MNILEIPSIPGSCEIVLLPGEHTPVLVNADTCPTTLCVIEGIGWLLTRSKPARRLEASSIFLQARNRPYVIWAGNRVLRLSVSLIRTITS